jgi:glycosyltransferase involved in cell wall biosynthesis
MESNSEAIAQLPNSQIGPGPFAQAGPGEPGLISCIVPVYNGERYLAETLDSIFGQTYRRLQVIVADDGSTDGTAEVVARYGASITYRFQPNAGVPAGRNLGLSAARGEFIAFLDADDLWHPEKLAHQVARFEARPALDMCVTLIRNFWVPELLEEQQRYANRRYAQALPGWVCPALLARRRLFEAVGGFNLELLLGDDNDWFLRAFDYGAVRELLPEVLVFRRLHQANMTRDLLHQAPKALLRVVKLTLDRRRQRRRIAD